jgi:hypothetical protein
LKSTLNLTSLAAKNTDHREEITIGKIFGQPAFRVM